MKEGRVAISIVIVSRQTYVTVGSWTYPMEFSLSAVGGTVPIVQLSKLYSKL